MLSDLERLPILLVDGIYGHTQYKIRPCFYRWRRARAEFHRVERYVD